MPRQEKRGGQSGAVLARLRSAIPPVIKLPYRYLAGRIPLAWRRSRTYHQTRALLRESQRWDRGRLEEHQGAELASLLRHCYAHVPYYRRIMKDRGLTPDDFHTPADLTKLPLLDKDLVRLHREELAATNFPPRAQRHQSTGGTSGRPLSFLVQQGVSEDREQAFIDTLWERVQVRPGDRLVVLRNNALPGQRLWEYNPRVRQLVLDPFKLSPGNVEAYLDAIRRSGIDVLHTYPSAATTLLKAAREAGVAPKLRLRAILASSENIYEGQRASLEEAFGARFFSWYGHSELLVLAGECEVSPLYHVFPEYGIIELISEKGDPVEAPGRPGRIVGTGFNNLAMPFLRYDTGDSAQWSAEQSCSCGRAYRLLTNVRGRWLQEMIVGRGGEMISITAMNLHSDALERVRQFQFVQDKPGEVEFRLVAGATYAEADAGRIREELERRLGGAVTLRMVRVEEIPRTALGKHRFLVQRLASVPSSERLLGETEV